MNANRGFDEVMIVNPSEEGRENYKGARLMRFHAGGPPGFGYYAEPSDPYGYYAEPPPDVYGYAEPPDSYGYYADPYAGYGYYAEDPYPPPNYGYYADPSAGYGYYADPSAGYGYYSQYPDMTGYGYYGQYPDMTGYAEPPAGVEPVGYYAEEYPMGYYGNEYSPPGYGQEPTYGYYAEEAQYPMGQHEEMGYWSQAPEMVGYGQYDPQTAYPGMGYYAEPDMSGYVRQTRSPFNAGCPMPTNVAGFDEDPLEGYVKPATVNPNCSQFTPQPGEPIPPPDGFKPLW